MFPGDSGNELESGCLRSGRRFRYGKQRNTLIGRGICSMIGGEEDYKLALYFDKWDCDKEEKYQLISETNEE